MLLSIIICSFKYNTVIYFRSNFVWALYNNLFIRPCSAIVMEGDFLLLSFQSLPFLAGLILSEQSRSLFWPCHLSLSILGTISHPQKASKYLWWLLLSSLHKELSLFLMGSSNAQCFHSVSQVHSSHAISHALTLPFSVSKRDKLTQDAGAAFSGTLSILLAVERDLVNQVIAHLWMPFTIKRYSAAVTHF